MATPPGYRDTAFHELLLSLEAMFPSWEQETLAVMLEFNHCDVERTIDQIFAMETDTSLDTSDWSQVVLHVPGELTSVARHEDAQLAQILQDEWLCQQVVEDEQLAQYLGREEEDMVAPISSASAAVVENELDRDHDPSRERSSSFLLSPGATEALASVTDKLSSMSLTMKAKIMDMVHRFQDVRDRSHEHLLSSRPLLDLENDEALEEDEEEEFHVFGLLPPSREEEAAGMTRQRRHQAKSAKKVSMWNVSSNQSPRSISSSNSSHTLSSKGDSKKKD